MTTEYPYYAVKDQQGHVEIDTISESQEGAISASTTESVTWHMLSSVGYSIVRVAIVEEPKA